MPIRNSRARDVRRVSILGGSQAVNSGRRRRANTISPERYLYRLLLRSQFARAKRRRGTVVRLGVTHAGARFASDCFGNLEVVAMFYRAARVDDDWINVQLVGVHFVRRMLELNLTQNTVSVVVNILPHVIHHDGVPKIREPCYIFDEILEFHARNVWNCRVRVASIYIRGCKLMQRRR